MKFLNYIVEGSKNPNWRGCLMLSVPKTEALIISKFTADNIEDLDLADDGIEDYVHITVLYGFSQTTDINAVEKFVKSYDNIDIEFGKISRFDADTNRPDSDVIKIEIESLALKNLHTALKQEFNVETSYPSFIPHCTLAYVTPGSCKDLTDDVFLGMKCRCDTLTYSTGDSENRKRKILTFEEIKRYKAKFL